MRACLQRVTEAAVDVIAEDGTVREAGRIDAGLVALVGFAPVDGEGDGTLGWMARKIADLRVFEGAGGALDRSLRDGAGELLLVSQFTLYGDLQRGRRPDFHAAAPFGEAERMYAKFRALCEKELPGRVASGEFGARMAVHLVNDGPVTLWIER